MTTMWSIRCFNPSTGEIAVVVGPDVDLAEDELCELELQPVTVRISAHSNKDHRINDLRVGSSTRGQACPTACGFVDRYTPAAAPESSTDTRMPSGSVPQYESARPVLPRNSINSHVAGNVAMKNTITMTRSALMQDSPFVY